MNFSRIASRASVPSSSYHASTFASLEMPCGSSQIWFGTQCPRGNPKQCGGCWVREGARRTCTSSVLGSYLPNSFALFISTSSWYVIVANSVDSGQVVVRGNRGSECGRGGRGPSAAWVAVAFDGADGALAAVFGFLRTDLRLTDPKSEGTLWASSRWKEAIQGCSV